MITLNSKRLRVELAAPGEAPNNKYRFDHAGFITEVILDNTVRFCASEPQNLNHPSSGGRGLCNEYGFDISKEVPTGEFFPRFGIGLIRKAADERFVFYKNYKDVQLFPIDVHQTENGVTYITEPIPCQGYALRSKKEITVDDNRIIMTISVENTGEKEISLHEYCHNFLSIDGMSAGPDYCLDIPGINDLGYERLIDSNGLSTHLKGYGKGITFFEHTAIGTFYSVDTANISENIPFTWTLSHKGAKASVEAEEYFTPSRINIWGVDHMLCPEMMHQFSVKPGETHEWKRSWKFDKQYD